MKIIYIVILLFFLASCGQNEANDVFIWEVDMENPFEGETLTIAVFNDYYHQEFANAYMAQNLGVEIEVEYLWRRGSENFMTRGT